MKNKKIIAIIPARGGSKGVPKKNIKSLAEKPLIAWTIMAALKSEYLDKVIVSTDSKEIAKISEKYGAEVPFLRPKKLARDSSPVMEAIRHSLDKLKEEKKYTSDIVVILQPTSPLRTTATIDFAIKVFLENFNQYDSLVPLFPIEGKIGKIKNGFYKPSYVLETRRQEIERIYKECGTIFILKTDLIIRGDDFGKKVYPFVIKDYKEALDIDTIDDFKTAECLLKYEK